MRILVVENESTWRMALKEMYLKALGQGAHAVDIAASISEARQALRASRYDIMSLDINMAETSPEADVGRPLDACGLDLLHYAHRQDRAEAVIVISGCTWDTKLSWVVSDVGQEIDIRTNMAGILENTFGNKGRFFPKPDPALVGVQDTIAVWQNAITKGYLQQLAEGWVLSRPYCLTIDMPGGIASKISVKPLRSKKSKDVREIAAEDVELVWLLVMQWQNGARGIQHREAAQALLGREEADRRLAKYSSSGEYASRSEKDRLAMMQRTVNGYVSSFKDRLRKLDLDPDGIIRNWGQGGWCLARDARPSSGASAKGTGTGYGAGAFDPTTVVSGNERCPDEIVAMQEQLEIRERFLALADSDQIELFHGLSAEQQEAVLGVFVRHECQWSGGQ